jgi:uncharacterized membrane-anchored protein YhcB (DUF1043 family)
MSQKKTHNEKFRNWKNTKFSSMAWILAILVLIIAVILNMIVARLDLNWDVSPNKQYSLSSTTESYLDQMDKDGVSVDFYILTTQEELEADLETLTLYRALLAYDAHDSINLIWVDPETDNDTMEKINGDNALTLSTGDMILICGDTKRRLPGSSMYVTYTDDDGNTTDEDFTGENYITGTIKGVVEGFTPTVYFLTGHGEKQLSQYTTFTTNLTNYNYDAQELNLSQVEAVPDDAAMILVAAPTADITDEEMERLNAYLDEGGNISLLMSPNGGSFAYTNLEKVMKDYGFYMDYDRVYETDSSCHISGDNTTILCELTELDDDSDAADLTSSLLNEGLYTYMPSSRSFRYFDDNGRYTIASLITTYETAVGEAYGGISDDPEDESGEMLLAAYSQANARNASKMTVFGNAEFLDDDHVTSETVIVPVYLYLSTISWMYDSDIDMEISSKSTTVDYIDLQSDTFAEGLMAVYTIVPLVIMGIGIGVWIKRRNS